MNHALVLHPEDKSTDFLKPIYEKLNNKIVIHTSKDFDKLATMKDIKEMYQPDFFGKDLDDEELKKAEYEAEDDDDSPYSASDDSWIKRYVGTNPYKDKQHGGTGKPVGKDLTTTELNGLDDDAYAAYWDEKRKDPQQRKATADEIAAFRKRLEDKKNRAAGDAKQKFEGDTIEDLEDWFDKLNPKKWKTWTQWPSYTGKGSYYQKYTPPKDLSQMIPMNNDFNRFLMMGHGSGWGLFSMANPGMIINDKTVRLLKPCSQNVYIWCNADQYVRAENLRGFYSGMFVSEVSEANAMNLKGVTQKQVNISNNAFARIVGNHINESVQSLHKHVKNEYEYFCEGNPVAEYNWNRLYVR